MLRCSCSCCPPKAAGSSALSFRLSVAGRVFQHSHHKGQFSRPVALCFPLEEFELVAWLRCFGDAGASVRNASRYRALLEAALPDIFESIQVLFQAAWDRRPRLTLQLHML